MSKKIPAPYFVDRDRWARLSIFEQMGNIGSKVGRTLKTKRKGEDFEPALIRTLDLFDATVEHLFSQKAYRVKEVLRAKDQFLYFRGIPIYEYLCSNHCHIFVCPKSSETVNIFSKI